MYCKDCGELNVDDAVYCRACGVDTGNAPSADKHNKKSNRRVTAKDVYSHLFMGGAFVIIAIILGVQQGLSASSWWYWMLIPGAAISAKGFAGIMALRKQEKALTEARSRIESVPKKQTLPPPNTQFVETEEIRRYETGELVPPSVTEGTTRLLDLEQEDKTRIRNETETKILNEE